MDSNSSSPLDEFRNYIKNVDYFYASPKRIDYPNNIDRFFPIRLSRLISDFEKNLTDDNTLSAASDVLCKMRIVQWQVMTKNILKQDVEKIVEYKKFTDGVYNDFWGELLNSYSIYCQKQFSNKVASKKDGNAQSNDNANRNNNKQNNDCENVKEQSTNNTEKLTDLLDNVVQTDSGTYMNLLSTIQAKSNKSPTSKNNTGISHIIVRDGEFTFYGLLWSVINAIKALRGLYNDSGEIKNAILTGNIKNKHTKEDEPLKISFELCANPKIEWKDITKDEFLEKLGLFYKDSRMSFRWNEFIDWLEEMNNKLIDETDKKYYEFSKTNADGEKIEDFSDIIWDILHSNEMTKYIKSQKDNFNFKKDSNIIGDAFRKAKEIIKKDESRLDKDKRFANSDIFYKSAIGPFIKKFWDKLYNIHDDSNLIKTFRAASLPVELLIRENNPVPFHLIICNLDEPDDNYPTTLGFATCAGINPPSPDHENFASIVTFLMGISSFHGNQQLVKVSKDAGIEHGKEIELDRLRHTTARGLDEIQRYLGACKELSILAKLMFWTFSETITIKRSDRNNKEVYGEDVISPKFGWYGSSTEEFLDLITDAALLQARGRFITTPKSFNKNIPKDKMSHINQCCEELNLLLSDKEVIIKIKKMLNFNITDLMECNYNWLTWRGFIPLYYAALWQAAHHALIAICVNDHKDIKPLIIKTRQNKDRNEQVIVISNKVYPDNGVNNKINSKDIDGLIIIADRMKEFHVTEDTTNEGYHEITITFTEKGE